MYRPFLSVECQHAVDVANVELTNGDSPTMCLFVKESNLVSIRENEAVLGAITGIYRSQCSQALGCCETHPGLVQAGQALSAMAVV